MRRFFTFLILATFTVFVSTAQEWNISSEDFNQLGVLEETTEVNGLTIYAHSGKKVEIDANNKSLDGMDYTHRLKLGGSGDFDENGLPLGRVLAFPVSGNTKITVTGMSSSSGEDRELYIAVDHQDSVFAVFPALGPDISKGEYNYTGGAGTIFLYSPSNGVNIYHLEAEPEKNVREWNISSDDFNSLGVLEETTEVNGLTIYAHSGKKVEVDANNKSLDGLDYTHRLKLGGSGDFNEEGQPLGRVLAIQVSGDAKITVIGMSSSSGEDRQLHLAADTEENIFATFPALGPDISKGEYEYTGGPATILLYSPSNGVNVYHLLVEEEQEEVVEPSDSEWNISADSFKDLGVLEETVTVNGLTIWAHSGKKVEIDANEKTLDDMDFTHRLKFGGQGDFDEDGLPLGRVISFEVEGNTNITVMAMSSSGSEDREIHVAAGTADNVIAAIPALGTELTKGECFYSGPATTIMLFSPHSGVNVYYLKAESVPTNVELTEMPEIRVYPNPATDRVFVSVNKPTQVAIYNLAGSVVKSRMIESQNDFINVSDLQPGMYIIKSQFSNDFAHKLIVR
jgi:hypothetical protein